MRSSTSANGRRSEIGGYSAGIREDPMSRTPLRSPGSGEVACRTNELGGKKGEKQARRELLLHAREGQKIHASRKLKSEVGLKLSE